VVSVARDSRAGACVERRAREVPKRLDALDLDAGRAGIDDRVVFRLACAASVGSERRRRGQPEGGEVLRREKPVDCAGRRRADLRSDLPSFTRPKTSRPSG
jgi:hypothetical protein